MTDLIYVDRENMERRMGDAVAQIDPLDQILSQLPPPGDAGTASAHISFIVAAIAEAANEYSGAVRLLGAITSDVLSDLEANDRAMSIELEKLEKQLDD